MATMSTRAATNGAAFPAPCEPAESTPRNDEPAWKIPKRPEAELGALGDLETLDKEFRGTYATERARVQQTLGPVVVLRLSGATLFRSGKIVETKRIIPAEYHDLRYASHVPFSIFLKLHAVAGAPLGDQAIATLRTYEALIQKAQLTLDRTSLRVEQLVRARRLFAESKSFLASVIEQGSVDPEGLLRYVRLASIDIERNIRDAGIAQVDGIHKQLLEWRRQIPDSEWRSVRFVVHAPQQPRGGNAATVYLSALVQDAGDGRGYVGESERVVFREDTSLQQPETFPPWEADLELLAAIDMDAIASEAIFSDPDRLAVDIAADGARSRVRELDLSQVRP